MAVQASDAMQRPPAWATRALVIDGCLVLAFTAFAPFGNYRHGFASVLPVVLIFALLGGALVFSGSRTSRWTASTRLSMTLFLGIVTLSAVAGAAASLLRAPLLTVILVAFGAPNAAGLSAAVRAGQSTTILTEARRTARRLRFAGARLGWPLHPTTTIPFEPPARQPAARALAVAALALNLGAVFLRVLRSSDLLIALGAAAGLGVLLFVWVKAATHLSRHGVIVVADDVVAISRLVRPLVVPRDAVTGIATALVRPQGTYYRRSRPQRTMILLGPAGLGLACVSAAMFSDDTIDRLAGALDLEWDRQWPSMQASDLDNRFPGAASFTLRHPWLVAWMVLLALLVPIVVLVTLLGQTTSVRRVG